VVDAREQVFNDLQRLYIPAACINGPLPLSHGGNRGSNPLRDASKNRSLRAFRSPACPISVQYISVNGFGQA
jgi:hypothetical protein